MGEVCVCGRGVRAVSTLSNCVPSIRRVKLRSGSKVSVCVWGGGVRVWERCACVGEVCAQCPPSATAFPLYAA